jgi:hypothetical protein
LDFLPVSAGTSLFCRHQRQSILKSIAIIRSFTTRVTPIKLGGRGGKEETHPPTLPQVCSRGDLID